MNISIINGSPKLGKNSSELLINLFLPQLDEKNTLHIYRSSNEDLCHEQLHILASSDILLFVFPLYIDSIPSHLLRLLIELCNKKILSKSTTVYCMINNGFFEGKQNHIAIEQMQHWCTSAGATWGQAIGIGAGEMLPFISNTPLGHGPNKNLGIAITEFVQNMQNKKSGKTLLISPNCPRSVWKLQSTLLVWYPRAKQNGLKWKDLFC